MPALDEAIRCLDLWPDCAPEDVVKRLQVVHAEDKKKWQSQPIGNGLLHNKLLRHLQQQQKWLKELSS